MLYNKMDNNLVFKKIITSLSLNDISNLCKTNKTFYTMCKTNMNYIKHLIKSRQVYVTISSDPDEIEDDWTHSVIVNREKPMYWNLHSDFIDFKKIEVINHQNYTHIYILFHFSDYNVDEIYAFTNKEDAKNAFIDRLHDLSREIRHEDEDIYTISVTDETNIQMASIYEYNMYGGSRWVLIKSSFS